MLIIFIKQYNNLITKYNFALPTVIKQITNKINCILKSVLIIVNSKEETK